MIVPIKTFDIFVHKNSKYKLSSCTVCHDPCSMHCDAFKMIGACSSLWSIQWDLLALREIVYSIPFHLLLFLFLFIYLRILVLFDLIHGSISNESGFFFIWIVFRSDTSTNNASINRRWHRSICLYGDRCAQFRVIRCSINDYQIKHNDL